MFKSAELKHHLETASVIRSLPKVTGEINLNDLGRISKIGNYRCDPSNGVQPNMTYFEDDPQTINATLSYAQDVLESGDVDDVGERVLNSVDATLPKLFPLQDVFGRHRPRSGINKLLYYGGYIDDSSSAYRPRYYVASRNDPFKYWTSYRVEDGATRGVSATDGSITDVAPFVVYSDTLLANRIVVKMQTQVGTEQIADFLDAAGNVVHDPFFGSGNSRTPKSFRVQLLKDGMWRTAYTFMDDVPADGYVELGYGLVLDPAYADSFELKGELEAAYLLPDPAGFDTGDAFLVGEGKGTLFVLVDEEWQSVTPVYGWSLATSSHIVKTLVDPVPFDDGSYKAYREFDWFNGVRIVVDSMNLPETTFDLIELSPRLRFDLTDRAETFSVTKTMGDLSQSALPVGDLRAGTGSIGISNTDFVLTESFAIDLQTGKGSVLAPYVQDEIKFDFSETIYNVNGHKYNVPIKTLWSEETPRVVNEPSTVSFELRDEYFIFEKASAPQLLLEDVSLSKIVMVLLDNIGFEKYAFLRNGPEPIIPYFFMSADMSVAEVLSALSQATQTAMYFDENNIFVVSMPEYALPSAGSRETDLILRGEDSDTGLANIQEISSSDRVMYNNGEVVFTKRYIQRQSRYSQSLYGDKEKEWIYSPTLLWEASGQDNVKAQNEAVAKQSSFTLSAFPLSVDLSNELPYVVAGEVTNNIINVGESANYFSSYDGYLWANGEIIHYDAIEFYVTGTGNVWIQSADEYQNYFLALPFNGKIYPTGMIRIYAEPFTETDDYGNTSLVDGDVVDHGRGKFDTGVANHLAGLNSEWSESLTGMFQNSSYLFTLSSVVNYPQSLSTDNPAGIISGSNTASSVARSFAGVSSEINNPLSRVKVATDVDKLQASALILSGAGQGRDHVSYVHRKMDDAYSSFGARMRIIGEILSSGNQQPIGAEVLSKPYMTTANSDLAVSGGGGGIGILLDPQKNHGYFLELQAVTSATDSYSFSEINHEVALGKLSGAVVTQNEVKVTLVDEPKTLEVEDTIAIASLPTTDIDINGSFTAKRVNGNDVYFDLTVVPYTFAAPYTSGAAITKASGPGLGTVNLANVVSISVDSKGVGLITFSPGYNHGFETSTDLTLSGFETSAAIPNINGTVDVTWFDDDEVKFQIPKRSFTFVDDLSGTAFRAKDANGNFITIGNSDIQSAVATDTNLTITFGDTGKVLDELAPVLAGGALLVDRQNLFQNPRMKTVTSTNLYTTNYASNPRATSDVAAAGAAVGRWYPSVYATTKTHGGRLQSPQGWAYEASDIKTSNIRTFTSLTYMKGKKYSHRGWLLAGNPRDGSAAPTSGEFHNTALKVTTDDSAVRIGFWVKASSNTGVDVMVRQSNAWRKQVKGKWKRNEIKVGSAAVTNDWQYVSYTYNISSPYNGELHIRMRFSTSGSKITYYATGLTIEKNPKLGEFFDSGQTIDPAYIGWYDSGNKTHSLYYRAIKHVSNVGSAITMQSPSYGDEDGASLRVVRSGGVPGSYARVAIGPVDAGRYVVTVTVNGVEDIVWNTSALPMVAVGASVQNIFLKPGEDGVRSSGDELRSLVTLPAGTAELYLPAMRDNGKALFYDNLQFEKIPDYIAENDIETLAYFDGNEFGCKWFGAVDDSISGMDDFQVSDARNTISSVSAGTAIGGGKFRYTITTEALNPDMAVDMFAVISGVHQLYSEYVVKSVSPGTRSFTIETSSVPGDISNPKVVFVAPIYVKLVGQPETPMYPMAITNPSVDSASGLITVAYGGPAHVFTNPFMSSSVTKMWTETQQLYNVFFYKTVSDDRGGRVHALDDMTIVVPTHTLKRGDKVKVTGTGALDTELTIVSLVGDKVILSGTPGTWHEDWWVGLVNPLATPFRLWAGLSSIVVDTGKFYGQQPNPAASDDSIYDICVEYSDGVDGRTFHLFLNDRKLGTVLDPDPLPRKDHAALFSRGGAKIMFEHFYAIGAKAGYPSPAGGASVLGNQNRFDLVRSSGAAGVLQSSFLSGVGDSSGYNVLYDEFGTIFREAAYMKVKYDQAFPSLITQIAPTPAGFKGYTVSGFQPNPYGADFMVFNCTDNLLALSEDTGNYLRLLGITFTQNTTHTVTIDELLERKSNVANLIEVGVVNESTSLYNRLRIDRLRHGDRKLSLQSDYIQSSAAAEKLLTWIMEKVSKPRKNIGLTIFPVPALQLGDLVSFKFAVDEKELIAPVSTQFVVYNIVYEKSATGNSMTVYVTEI